MVKIIWASLKKSEPLRCHQPIADIGDYAPGGEMCWCGVNFPRDWKCQILSSLTVEIAFKRCKQTNISVGVV